MSAVEVKEFDIERAVLVQGFRPALPGDKEYIFITTQDSPKGQRFSLSLSVEEASNIAQAISQELDFVSHLEGEK